jgi:platelet-activating factor acetylhydrolase IB subunit alpha
MMFVPLVTCSSDLFIKIWDSENEWKNVKTFPGHEHSVSSVRFMPGDQFIVSASRDRTIRVFDVASTFVFLLVNGGNFMLISISARHLVRTIVGHSDWVRRVVPSDDGRLLASCSSDHVSNCTYPNCTRTDHFYQTARIWDAQAGESKMELRGHEHVVEVVTFAPIAAYSALRELAGLPVRSS